MRALVIQAHPLRSSYNEALLASTLGGLGEAGVTSIVHRLYDGADPGPDDLAGASIMALVYPTWWGGFPAVLLDWVQRRLGPSLDGDAPSPLLSVEHLVAVTSHGSSKWVNALQGEPGKHHLQGDILRLCRPGARMHWVSLYRLDRRSPAELTAHLERAHDRVRDAVA